MRTCPFGHPSAEADYCTVCGVDLVEPVDPICRSCHRPLRAQVRYCEHCGTQVDPASWSVTVIADRAWFEARNGARHGIAFPERTDQRRVALAGSRIRIGRRSVSRRHHPEIDLSAPPRDPGVSREHAELIGQPDGSWTLRDSGSANGTYLNDRPNRLPPGHEAALAAGDRIHVGAWTTLVLCRDA